MARFDPKRPFDILLSAPGLILLAPVIALVAVAVAAALGRPVFFRQVRPGLGGRPFRLVKFRTMLDAVDSHGKPLDDSRRLTRFGRILRATSLDELPELWNVLKGDMSLVGPRPLLMHYLPLYTPEQARRHDVRPGLTGWTQVNGRNALSWSQKLAFDTWYVDHRSFRRPQDPGDDGCEGPLAHGHRGRRVGDDAGIPRGGQRGGSRSAAIQRTGARPRPMITRRHILLAGMSVPVCGPEPPAARSPRSRPAGGIRRPRRRRTDDTAALQRCLELAPPGAWSGFATGAVYRIDTNYRPTWNQLAASAQDGAGPRAERGRVARAPEQSDPGFRRPGLQDLGLEDRRPGPDHRGRAWSIAAPAANGHGISAWNSNNFQIVGGVEIADCWGDGIYVGSAAPAIATAS